MRSRRAAAIAVAGYAWLVVVSHVAVWSTVAVGRVASGDPSTAYAGIPRFRVVDEQVWAGGQPDDEAYRALAEGGVTLVVDLRTGAADDPREADADQLRRLGLDYLGLAVPDGHVPSAAQVDRFVAAVEGNDGIVFVHCGGGVGRTSALQAAYRRGTGDEASLTAHAALGPHTVEQLWYVATGETNPVVRRASEALDAPRRAWSRLRAQV